MEYCDKCDNVLDISKTILSIKNKIFSDITPSTVSESDDKIYDDTDDKSHDKTDGIKQIIKKILNNTNVTNSNNIKQIPILSQHFPTISYNFLQFTIYHIPFPTNSYKFFLFPKKVTKYQPHLQLHLLFYY